MLRRAEKVAGSGEVAVADKPELTEAQKTLARTRQELARVLDRLRSPPLSHGMARELRKNAASLERENRGNRAGLTQWLPAPGLSLAPTHAAVHTATTAHSASTH